MSKGWDNNMLKKLKMLVGKGLSASEIGRKLEVSKNAVIGKLNRLGWNAKATEAPTKSSKMKKDSKSGAKKETANAKVKTVKKATKAVVKKEVAKKTTKGTSSAKVSAKTKVESKKVDKKADKKIEVQKPAIKTASKKTKKDLALHELLIQHALQMANLKPNQCRWPIGDPDSDNFHFCGEAVFAGKPYCYEHCRQAYQFTPPKKK